MKRFADLAFLRQWGLSSLILAIVGSLSAQDIAMGTWRTHFSYKDAKHLVITPEKIFCASENGLFSRDLITGETRKLSKIDGLSDVGVSAMAYNEDQNILVIGYRSGFIDFIFEDRILSISDLATSNLDINKTINDIAFGSDRTYLGTDVGIIVVNTIKVEVSENFVQIGNGGGEVSVSQILIRGDDLFVRTPEGIQSGNLNANLLDFNNWNRYAGSSGYENLILSGNEIFATSGTRLLQLGAVWNDTGVDLPIEADALFSVDDKLITVDDSGNVSSFNGSAFQQEVSTSASLVNDIAKSGDQFFFADGTLGLVDQSGNLLSPDGPLADYFSNFRVLRGDFYGFHAPSPFSYSGLAQQPSFSIFSNGQWSANGIENFTNVSDVAEFKGNYFYSSIGDGLYDEAANQIVLDIPGSSAQLDTVLTSLGSGDNLWVSSFGNLDPIHVLNQDDEWLSFGSTQLFDDEFLTIDLSDFGIGWLGSSSGTITVLDPSEGNADLISTSDGLPSSFIDVDISVEDNAWVATSRGPALFLSASFIFSNSEAILPTFENRLLFEGQQINAVITDGGNRVWFGTNTGIWIYNENTSQQVAVFNEANSPLPSNNIIQMAYNPSNGEVFIQTDRGMISYRSSSSKGSKTHQNVNIFPNPVRPNYTGLVGLTGLAGNVNIKVTDVSGTLVTELEANGGSASWDLMDSRGGKVTTGIYLFFSSSRDGEETYVGKIAVVR
jgi:hypothetical protein